MPVSSGGRLGPYELLSSLGAGGMGEVYRARDSRLARDVAVKVISADGAPSLERLQRFEQEAKTVAALDHPHILSVHDVGIENGTAFVVFELLEGETLRQRLERGAIPTRKAVELAVQMCQGLAAAHARGIIHRDLKPENLFLTKDGRLKILDFGLAKLKETPEREEELKKARTHTATEQGMLLGTVGYMSPEQARGKPADARSDLFAVGAIAYEMLSGRRAFEGATAADLLSAILTREPPEIAAPNGAVPSALERVVRRCLEKDPEDRFQSARDVAFALEALSGESRAGTHAGTIQTGSRRLRARLTGAALLAVGAVSGIQLGRMVWDRPLPAIKPLTFRRGVPAGARFTSDGKTVVYTAFWDGNPAEIFSTRVEGPESRSLGLPPANLMSISSQGELAILLPQPGVFTWPLPGTLARVPLSGGAPRKVLDDVVLADWSPDGRDFAVVRQVGSDPQLEYPVGKVLARPVDAGHMRVSPRGDRVAAAPWGPDTTVYDRVGNKTILRTPPVVGGLAWAGDDALWFAGGATIDTMSLWRATLDGKTREVYRPATGMVLIDASSDGRILVRTGIGRLGVRGKPPGEAKERELGVFSWSGLADLSSDGTQLLIGEGGGTAAAGAYLQSMHGGPPVRLGEGSSVALSPDGQWALIASWQPQHVRLTLTPTGPGEARVLPADRFESASGGWFTDNGHVLVQASEPGRSPRMFLFDLSGGEPRPVTPEGIVGIDSRTVNFVMGWPGGGSTLARYPLAGGEPEPIPARIPRDAVPVRVTADGRSLLLFAAAKGQVDRLELATGRVTPWKVLRPDDLTGVTFVTPPILAPGADAYAYNYCRILMNLYLIEGLR